MPADKRSVEFACNWGQSPPFFLYRRQVAYDKAWMNKNNREVPGGVRHCIWFFFNFSNNCSWKVELRFRSLKTSRFCSRYFGIGVKDFLTSFVLSCGSWGFLFSGKATGGAFRPLVFCGIFSLVGELLFPYLSCKRLARTFAFWISSADIGRLLLECTALATGRFLPALLSGCSTSRTFLRSLISVVC